jgi:hypothetical protein
MADETPASPRIPHRKIHRWIFIVAGAYNLIWGAYAVLDPQWMFRFTGMPPSNYPQIFACLGMVIGLYGIVYFEVARVPERGWVLAAVGLIGKILGPIGMTNLVVRGIWPRSAFILCATNDLIWWIPFAWYLYDAWPAFRRDLAARH